MRVWILGLGFWGFALLGAESMPAHAEACDFSRYAENVDHERLLSDLYFNFRREQKPGLRFLELKRYFDELDNQIWEASNTTKKTTGVLDPLNLLQERWLRGRSAATRSEIALFAQNPLLGALYKSLVIAPELPTALRSRSMLKTKEVLNLAAKPFSAFHKLFKMRPQKIANFRKINPGLFELAHSVILGDAGFAAAFRMTLGVVAKPIKPLVALLNPLPPGLLPFLINPEQRIARMQLKNPHLRFDDLNRKDQMFLTRAALKNAFESRGKFLAEFPRLRMARLMGSELHRSLLVLSYATALLVTLQENSSDFVDFNTFEDDWRGSKKFQPHADEAQLLVTMSPLPHMAVRINERVYSYGVQQMSALNWAEYLQRFNKTGGLADALEKIHPASTQVATIKLGSVAEADELAKYFEEQNNKTYVNVTGINDCATMVIRGFREKTSVHDSILRAIDASPSQLYLYFSTLHLLGDPRVPQVYTLMHEAQPSAGYQRLRNFVENNAESKYFLNPYTMIFNQAKRMRLDATHSAATLQTRLPEDSEYMASVKNQAKNNFWERGNLFLYEQKRIRMQEAQTDDRQFLDSYIKKAQDVASDLKLEVGLPQVDVFQRAELEGELEGVAELETRLKTLLAAKL